MLLSQGDVIVMRTVNVVALVAAITLMVVAISNLDFSGIIVTAFYAVAFVCIVWRLTSYRTLMSPTVFALFFVVGFLVKPAVDIQQMETVRIGFGTGGLSGAERFSGAEMFVLYSVALCGLVGVTATARLMDVRFRDAPGIEVVRLAVAGRAGLVWLAFVCWAVAYLGVVYAMKLLGIGVHGIAPGAESALPFKGVGVLVYLNRLILPLLGLLVLDMAISSFRGRRLLVLLAVYVLVTAFGAAYTLQRSMLLFPLLLFGSWLFVHRQRLSIRWGTVLMLSGAFIVMLSFASAVTEQRKEIYHGPEQELKVVSLVEAVSPLDAVGPLVFLGQSLAGRVEGSREVMAVNASPRQGLDFFVELFSGATDVSKAVYGYTLRVKGKAFGITIGMLGLLFSSGSLVVSFLGSALMAWLVFFVEYRFRALGFGFLGFCAAFYWIIIVWGNLTLFFFLRYAASTVVVFLAAVAVRRVLVVRNSPGFGRLTGDSGRF